PRSARRRSAALRRRRRRGVVGRRGTRYRSRVRVPGRRPRVRTAGEQEDAMSSDTDELGYFAMVRSDLEAVARLKGVPFPSLGALADILMLPGTWAVLLFRTAHALHHSGLRPFSRILYFANVVLFGADLAPGARIGPGLAIAHPVFCGWGNELEI